MQSTEIGDTLSEMKYIKCGVPQGSILGPLLFLLYIIDITASSSSFRFFLFADDTSILFSHKDNPEKIINRELQKVSDWLSTNKLRLNVGKSKLLSLSLCNKQMVAISINETIEETRGAKYLGVLIDNKLQ